MWSAKSRLPYSQRLRLHRSTSSYAGLGTWDPMWTECIEKLAEAAMDKLLGRTAVCVYIRNPNIPPESRVSQWHTSNRKQLESNIEGLSRAPFEPSLMQTAAKKSERRRLGSFRSVSHPAIAISQWSHAISRPYPRKWVQIKGNLRIFVDLFSPTRPCWKGSQKESAISTSLRFQYMWSRTFMAVGSDRFGKCLIPSLGSDTASRRVSAIS